MRRSAPIVACAVAPALAQTPTATSVLGAVWDDSDGNGMVEIGQVVTISMHVEFTDARAFAGYWFDFVVLRGRGDGRAMNGDYIPGTDWLTSPLNRPAAIGPVYVNIDSVQGFFDANEDNPIGVFQYDLLATRAGSMTIGSEPYVRSQFPGINLYGLPGPIDLLFAVDGDVLNFEEPVTFTIAPSPGAIAPLLIASGWGARRRR